MRTKRLTLAAALAVTLTLAGTTLRAQYGGGGGGGSSSSGGSGSPGSAASSTDIPFACPLSTSSQAPTSVCVTVVIGPNSVGKGSSAFGANPLNVSLGTTVIWVNQDTVEHTVTADDGSFDSETLQPGQYFAHTFNEAGDNTYYCAIHGRQSMSGAVSVSSTPATPVTCPVCQGTPQPTFTILAIPIPYPVNGSPRPTHSPTPRPSGSCRPARLLHTARVLRPR